jgi:hypothetical protein
MPTPRLNQLSIDISKLLNDEVGVATADGEEFTASQRLLALNRAEGQFISKAVADQDGETLEKTFNEMLDSNTLVSGISPSAVITNSAKTLRLSIAGSYAFPVSFKDWGALKSQYNPETTALYDSDPTYHWTEYGRKIHWFPADPLGDPPVAYYVKDHVDLTYNGASDFLVPARYDAEILKIAYEFLTQILIKE